jgi:two-component system response regulator QseB
MRILLAEDDRLIGSGIKAWLKPRGFETDWLQDGEQAYRALECSSYDAVILDLGLPTMDGMDVLRLWRRDGRTEPVLILTARDELSERVRGLNTGADDYLVKPFEPEELEARLLALIRRRGGSASPVISAGRASLDQASRTATLDGRPVPMTAREYRLCEIFMLNRGRVLPKNLLEDKMGSLDGDASPNSIEVLVHRLRCKFGSGFIKTVRGIGYTLGSAGGGAERDKDGR